MQSTAKNFISVLLDSDPTLTANERDAFTQLLHGVPAKRAPTDGTMRLISAREAWSRLGCGKTHFYALREVHPELTPVAEFGKIRYRLDWVLALVDRASSEALAGRGMKGGAPCRSN